MLFSRDQCADAQQHLGDGVADYVDGMLSPDDEYRADIHLTVCEHCRYAVQQERAILEQLRSVSFDSGGHQQLMAGLLSLASSEPDTPRGAAPAGGGGAGSSRSGSGLPGLSRPAGAPRPAPAVMTCSAPPQYLSARRSMACALFAVAGCVGVALVASTATGVATGPDNPQQQTPDRTTLVRHVQAPRVAEAATPRGKVSGTLTQDMPMFAQAAARHTP